MRHKIEQSWDHATWAGSRRAMILQSLKLTVRERLQALEILCETGQALATIKIQRRKQTDAPNQVRSEPLPFMDYAKPASEYF